MNLERRRKIKTMPIAMADKGGTYGARYREAARHPRGIVALLCGFDKGLLVGGFAHRREALTVMPH
jgi:hypothetical protein